VPPEVNLLFYDAISIAAVTLRRMKFCMMTMRMIMPRASMQAVEAYFNALERCLLGLTEPRKASVRMAGLRGRNISRTTVCDVSQLRG
jgi:hypothetical protein